jgi:hypothetical protein
VCRRKSLKGKSMKRDVLDQGHRVRKNKDQIKEMNRVREDLDLLHQDANIGGQDPLLQEEARETIVLLTGEERPITEMKDLAKETITTPEMAIETG